MTLKTYIKKLQELEEKHPNAKVIYSIDDEGNGFGLVHHEPCAGHFKDGEFSDVKDNYLDGEINAVCIN